MRRGRLQIERQRRLLALQALLLAQGQQAFDERLLRQRFARQWVQHHLAARHPHLDEEMPREGHPGRLQPQALRQLQPQHRQRDGDAAARAQHGMQVAVVRRVVVVGVAGKAQLAVEEMVQQAQALQLARVGRQPPRQARLQRVHVGQHLLHVQLGIFVLRQAGGRLQQRQGLTILG